MDKNVVETYVQEIKDFLSKPCANWIRSEYNKRIMKKLEELHTLSIKESENLCRLKAGEISGFKQGFELLETLIKESEREEE